MPPDDAQSVTLLCGARQEQDLLPTTECLTLQIWCPKLCRTSTNHHYSPDTVGEDEAGSLVVH